MSRRPAQITQAEIARIIRAAQQAGAAEVVVHLNGAQVTVKLAPSTATDNDLAPRQEIVL